MKRCRGKVEKYTRKASKMVGILASLETLTVICLENLNKTSPLQLRKTPPITARPRLPLAYPT